MKKHILVLGLGLMCALGLNTMAFADTPNGGSPLCNSRCDIGVKHIHVSDFPEDAPYWQIPASVPAPSRPSPDNYTVPASWMPAGGASSDMTGSRYTVSGGNVWWWDKIYFYNGNAFCLSPNKIGHVGAGENPTVLVDAMPYLWAKALTDPPSAESTLRGYTYLRSILCKSHLGANYVDANSRVSASVPTGSATYADQYKQYRTSTGAVVCLPVISTKYFKADAASNPVVNIIEEGGQTYVSYVYDITHIKGDSSFWDKGPLQASKYSTGASGNYKYHRGIQDLTIYDGPGKDAYDTIPGIDIILPTKPTERVDGVPVVRDDAEKWGVTEYGGDKSTFAIKMPISSAPQQGQPNKKIRLNQVWDEQLVRHTTYGTGKAPVLIGYKANGNNQNQGNVSSHFLSFELEIPPVTPPNDIVVKILKKTCPAPANRIEWSEPEIVSVDLNSYTVPSSWNGGTLVEWVGTTVLPPNAITKWSDVPTGNRQQWDYPNESYDDEPYWQGYPTFVGGTSSRPTHSEGGGNTVYILYSKSDECEECTEGDCQDCAPVPPSITEVRWHSLPLAFAETKNGSGYNETGETTQGKFTWPRDGERFEAMMGIPETERLYINGGGSEGQIDVTYEFITVTQTFCLNWSEIHTCGGHSCGYGCIWYHATGTRNYTRRYTHQFSFLSLKNGSYRTPDKMVIENPDLYEAGRFEISINTPLAASHTVTPKQQGLNKTPGTDSSKINRNMGATNNWAVTVTVGPYTEPCGDMAGPLDETTAISDGNARVGNIFAQNDALKINIGGEEYVLVESPNTKSCQPFGNETPLIAAIDESFFLPVSGGGWNSLDRIPIFGYNGQPETGVSRNLPGSTGNTKPFIREDIEIVKRQVNGMYDFDDYANKNYLSYGNSFLIRDSINDLHSNTDEIKPISTYGIVDEGNYLSTEADNSVRVEYTDWQFLGGSHAGKVPDGNRDQSTDDNPHYFSVNPVLIHNPTPAIYSWISDIPTEQLQDQRILPGTNPDNRNDFFITQHPRVYTKTAPARQYIDFDFKLYIPNDGPFQSYWNMDSLANSYGGNSGSGRSDLGASGIIDPDEASPGTRGKGYVGTPQARELERSWNTPYSEQTWNNAKWITAKYVKFPYDVWYYKNSGEIGGSSAAFYDAGTWIKLYDNNNEVSMADPKVFNFHVASHQKDLIDGHINVVVENINTPAALRGRPQALFDDAEWYINGKRDKSDGAYTAIGGKAPIMSASHSARQAFLVDGIGRIGNALIEDSSDPAWKEVFWSVDSSVNPLTQAIVSKDYGAYYNMFEQQRSAQQLYNRYGTLQWHNQSSARTLPVMLNPLPLKNKQAQKLGYENQASVQTLGDHDGKMLVYPRYSLVGNWKTGDPKTQSFKFYAQDPFDSSGAVREFYDSRLDIGKFNNDGSKYRPAYEFLLNHTLADTRAKMSAVEKATQSYIDAVAAGSNKKYFNGQPHWIEIGQDLRTWHGSNLTTGYIGHGTGTSVVSGFQTSTDSSRAWPNAQKWNFRFSLPRNTMVLFLNGNEQTGRFEERTKNQFIYTDFVYRTWGGFPDWDLSTFTNTGVEIPLPNNRGTINDDTDMVVVPPPSSDEEHTDMLTPGDSNFPAVVEPEYIDDPQTGSDVTTPPGLPSDNDNPSTPQIVVDYSNPSNTDKTTIGTH